MSLPDFLHVGAAKCASTWLYRACLEHPEVGVPPANDNVNFFLSTYHRGLSWYADTYFAGLEGYAAVGEFSNAYMVSDLALERLARDLPGVRLTVTLRDPVERAYISWAYEKRKRRWTPEQQVRIDMVFHPNRWQFFRQWVEPSLYGAALRRIMRHVPRERLLVLFHQDLVHDPRTFLRAFFGFLEVDRDFVPAVIDQQINGDQPGEDLASCPPELVRELRDATRDDVAVVEQLTGRELPAWKGEA